MPGNSIDVVLGLDIKGFVQGIGQASKATAQFGTGLVNRISPSKLALGELSDKVDEARLKILAFSATVVASGAGAATAAASYQREFSKITGLVGIAAEEVDKMAKSTLNLAGATATAPQELAEAMFVVTSAGLRGSEALDTLELAAKGAAAGMGETADIARAVAAATNAYGVETLSVAKANDILAATARAGNFEVSGLSAAIGRVLPVSAQLGLSFEEVGGAIALLTRGGLSAAESITAVRAILSALLSPTEAASKALAEVGLSMEDVKRTLQQQGLQAALEQLYDAVGRNDEAFAKLIGSQEAVGSAFTIIGASADEVQQTFGAVADSTGVLQEAFDSTADTAAFKFQAAMQELKVALITLGNELLPVVAKLAEFTSFLVGTFTTVLNAIPGPLKDVGAALFVMAAAAGPAALALNSLLKAWLFFHGLRFKGEIFGAAASGMNKLTTASTASSVALGRQATASTAASAAATRSAAAFAGMSTAAATAGTASAGASAGLYKMAAAMKVTAAGAAVLLAGIYVFKNAWDQFHADSNAAADATVFFDDKLKDVPGTAQNAEAAIYDLTTALNAMTDEADDAADAVDNAFTEALAQRLGTDLVDALDSVGISMADVRAGGTELAAEMQSVEGQLTNTQDGLSSLVGGWLGWNDEISLSAEHLRLVNGELDPVTVAFIRLADSGQYSTEQLREWADVLGVTLVGLADSEAKILTNAEAWDQLTEGLNSTQQVLADFELQKAIAEVAALGDQFTEAEAKEEAFGRAIASLEDIVAKATIETGNFDDALVRNAIAITLASTGTLDWSNVLKVLERTLGDVAAETEVFGKAIGEVPKLLDDIGQDGARVFTDIRNEVERLNEAEIELGFDASELEDNLATVLEDLYDVTEEDWEAILTGDSSDIDDDVAYALLRLAGFSDTEAKALLLGDDAQLRAAILLAAVQLNLIDEATATAIIDADASPLFAAAKAAVTALKAVVNAERAAGLETRATSAAFELQEKLLIRNIQTTRSAAINAGTFAGALATIQANYQAATAAGDRNTGSVTTGGRAARAASGDVDELAESTDELTESTDGLTEIQKELSAESIELYTQLGILDDTTVELTDTQRDQIAAFEELVDATAEYLDEVDAIVAANEDITESFGEIESAIGDAVDAFDSITGIEDTLYEAQIAFTDARLEAEKFFAELEEPATLDLSTEGGGETFGILQGYRDAALELSAAIVATTGDIDGGIAAWENYRQQIIDVGVAAGLARADIEAILPTGAEAASILIGVEIDSEAARGEFIEFRDDLQRFDGTTVDAKLIFDANLVDIERVQVLLGELSAGEYIAQLDADFTPVQAAVATGVLELAGYSQTEALALLDADPAQAQLAIAAVLLDLGLISNKEVRAILSADTNPFDTRLVDVFSRLDEFANADARVVLEMATEGFDRAAFESALQLENLTKTEAIVDLAADATVFDAEMARVILAAAGFSERRATKFIEGDASRLNETLLAIGIAVGAFEQDDVVKIIDANPELFDGKIDSVTAKANRLAEDPVNIQIDVDGDGQADLILGGLLDDVTALDLLDPDIKPVVEEGEINTNRLRRIEARLVRINDGPWNIDIGTDKIRDAQQTTVELETSLGNVAGTYDVSFTTNAPDTTTAANTLETAAVAAEGIRPVDFTTNAAGPTGEANTLEAAAVSAEGTRAVDFTTNAAGPTGESRSLEAAAVAAEGTRAVNFTTNASAVAGEVRGLSGAIAGVQGKSVTISVNTHYTSSGSSAEQNFADGGFAVPSFADGGFYQNNNAHIAAPTGGPIGLYRYAEAETGGEALIPMGLSKRTRSEQIVKTVVRHFGGQVVGFADGGLVRQPTGFSGGGRQGAGDVTIHAPITINGTPGEDVTRMVQRGIEDLERSVKMEMARR